MTCTVHKAGCPGTGSHCKTEPDQLFADPIRTTWTRPKKAGACGRDPASGSGTCYYWWDGCPDAEKRGCYAQWAEKMCALGYVPIAPGVAGQLP